MQGKKYFMQQTQASIPCIQGHRQIHFTCKILRPRLDVKCVLVFVDVQTDRLLQDVVALRGRLFRAENVPWTVKAMNIHVVPLCEDDAPGVIHPPGGKVPFHKRPDSFEKTRDLPKILSNMASQDEYVYSLRPNKHTANARTQAPWP